MVTRHSFAAEQSRSELRARCVGVKRLHPIIYGCHAIPRPDPSLELLVNAQNGLTRCVQQNRRLSKLFEGYLALGSNGRVRGVPIGREGTPSTPLRGWPRVVTRYIERSNGRGASARSVGPRCSAPRLSPADARGPSSASCILVESGRRWGTDRRQRRPFATCGGRRTPAGLRAPTACSAAAHSRVGRGR